jgi:hypothetical protein
MLVMAVPFGALPVFAADSSVSISECDTVEQVETLINGATLTASSSGGTVTVTGSFTFDETYLNNISIRLYPGVTVKWQATLADTYVDIDNRSTGGTFEMAGGSITYDNYVIRNTVKAVKVKVSGGRVYSQNDELDNEGAIKAAGDVEITGGEIISDNYSAVELMSNGLDDMNNRETLTVSGSALLKANSDSGAIEASSYKIVNINGGTITGDADNTGEQVLRHAIKANDHTTINVNGGTLNGGIYLNAYDELNIEGGTVTNHGPAVHFYDGNNELNVDGGTLTSSFNGVIFTSSQGTGGTNIVNISGGDVRIIGTTFFAIDGDFAEVNISGGEVTAAYGAIDTTGDVTVSGGSVKSSLNMRAAIYASGAVVVSGGLVYANKGRDVISEYSSLNVTGGMVIGFDAANAAGQYADGYSTDIYFLPDSASVVWDTEDTTTGISYANGTNTGFIPISGPGVVTSSDTVNITGKTAAEISDAIADAFDTFGTVMVTDGGANTGLTAGISISIPNEKTLNWSARAQAAEGMSSDLLTISGAGTFNMNGGYIKNAYADGIQTSQTVKINIKGGEISVSDDVGINSTGTGLIEVTNAAIKATTTGGMAIYSAGQINIKNGSTIEVPYGTALQSLSRITIYDIVVLCEADAATGSGGFANAASGVSLTQGAVIVAWDTTAGNTEYDQYSDDDLDFLYKDTYSGSVRWDIKDGVAGVQFTDRYSAGDSVFIAVEDVTVTALEDTIDISGMTVTQANAAIAAAITSVGNAGKYLLTVVGTGMTINDSIVINLNEQVTTVNWYADLTAGTGMTNPLMTISTTHTSGTVNNFAKIISTDGYAFQGATNTRVDNYGFIFGNSATPNNIVNTPDKSSPSLLMSWDKSQGTTTYGVGTDNDILISNMSEFTLDSINVLWAYENGQSGIKYSYSDEARHMVGNGEGGFIYFYYDDSGFIPIPGVTVVRNDVVIGDLTYTIPDNHTYNGEAQGVGTVSFTSLTETQAGTISVEYEGEATVPTNAGTYTVTAVISGGSEYKDTTIELGEYTIAQKSLTVTGATVAAKYADETAAASVTGVTMTGDIDELVLTTDYTAAGVYDTYTVGTGKTVTVTVTLLNTAKANNYTVSSTYQLTGQTINEPPTEVTFSSVAANGTSGTGDTTELTLTFDQVITGLSVDDITVTGAQKGTLSSSGSGVYILGISDITGIDLDTFEQGDTVTVSVSKEGFTVVNSSKDVTVNKDTRPDVTFSAEQTGGSSGTVNSTGIVLTFSESVTGLTADDITITPDTGTATKGALSGSGLTWTIGLSDVSEQGNVTVAVRDFGAYDIVTVSVSTEIYKVFDNAEAPNISVHPTGGTYAINATPTNLSVTASVTDGGTLTYQWYSNSANSTEGGSSIGSATTNTYTPSTATDGTTYYYCIVTNSNTAVNGTQTATSTSSVAQIIVLPDATVSPATASYTIGESGAINITLTPNGHTLTEITDLTEGTHYVRYALNPNVFTINTTYLDSLSAASHTLTFDMSGGVDPTVTITVNEPTFVPVTGITLVSAAANTAEVLTLSGVVAPSNATNQTIAWAVSNQGTTNAEINGDQFTATAEGTAEVTATITNGLNASSNYTATFNISVDDDNIIIEPVDVESVSISGDSEVEVGSTIQLTANVFPANASNTNVSWTTSSSDIAVVNSSGVVTGRNAGTATITAISADGGITATTEVMVNAIVVPPAVPVTGVTLTGTQALTVGETAALTAAITPTDASNPVVTWSSDNTAVATVTNGTVTAISPGTAVIKVTTDDGAFEASLSITVNAVYIPPTPNPRPNGNSSSNSSSNSNKTPPAPPTPTPNDPEPNPYVTPSMDVMETENGTEYSTPSGAKSTVTESEEGEVKVEAGVNESGSVNSQSTAAAISEAAQIARKNGESSVKIQIPEGAVGLSKSTVQKFVDAAKGMEITLELKAMLDGEIVGGVTLPLTSETGQILTGLEFGTNRTQTAADYVTKHWDTDILGSFETVQKGGWGTTATLSVGLDKLGFSADDGTKLYALIYDSKTGKWYEVPAEVIDGNVIFDTKRSGVITIVTKSVKK